MDWIFTQDLEKIICMEFVFKTLLPKKKYFNKIDLGVCHYLAIETLWASVVSYHEIDNEIR